MIVLSRAKTALSRTMTALSRTMTALSRTMTGLSRIALWSALVIVVTAALHGAANSSTALRVGVSLDVPGINCEDPGTGEIGGFEPNLARAIAARLPGGPDRVRFVQVSNKQRITALQVQLVDMVISQLTITPERENEVDFSVPYYVAQEALLATVDSGIGSFEDLEGKRIAVPADSVSLQSMREKLLALDDATLVIVPSVKETFEAVEDGEADAAVSNFVSLELWRDASASPDRYRLIDLSGVFERKPWAIAVQKGDRSLLDRLNRAIESLESDGDLDRLFDEAVAAVTKDTASECTEL